MSRRRGSAEGFSPEDRAEMARMMNRAYLDTGGILHEFMRRIEELVEEYDRSPRPDGSRRFWPNVLRRRWVENGIRKMIDSWDSEREKAAVAYNGKILNQRSGVSVRRTATDGTKYQQLTLMHFLGWDELDNLIREFTAMRDVYIDKVVYARKLRTLKDKAPDTANPDQAAAALGTTVEQYLLQDVI